MQPITFKQSPVKRETCPRPVVKLQLVETFQNIRSTLLLRLESATDPDIRREIEFLLKRLPK